MKFKIILMIDKSVDSKAEVEHELKVLKEITGVVSQTEIFEGKACVVYKGEFHEFYQRVKDRITRRIKTYE